MHANDAGRADGGAGGAPRSGAPRGRPDTLDAEALEALFAGLRFADPPKAAALWRGLACAEAEAPRRPELVVGLLEELAASPDPDLALVNLARFVESTIAPGTFFNSLCVERPIARLLAVSFSCSSHLADILARNPEYLAWLIEGPVLGRAKAHSEYRAELAAQTAAFADPRRRLNSVKRYQRREMLRIGVRDLLGLAPVEEVTAELSFLADAVIDAALELAFAELAPQDGVSPEWRVAVPAPFHRFAVVSLGKLGGTELNYSSDVDLLFVRADTGDPREDAFYTELARRVVEILSLPTEEGTLYRVDLRLRPDGESGALVVSLAEHLAYLQRRARPWEIQALIKARRSAGSVAVADAFIERCSRALYAPAGGDPLGEILTMRERALAGLPPAERAGNVKLMSGGIRDIEWIVQAMQMVHGRDRPEVRSRNTLEAIERLAHYGLLSGEVREALARAYRLFRTTEHRLQMLRNVRAHTLPADEGRLAIVCERVARSALGLATGADARAALARSILEVQDLFASFFRDRGAGPIPLLLSLPPGERAVAELLARYGIREGEASHRALASLVFGDYPALEGADTFTAAARSLPTILEEIGRAPDPSLALRNVVRIVKASGAVRSTLDLLGEGGDFLRLILAIAAQSTRLAEVLARRMEILDLLAEGAPPPPAPAAPRGAEPYAETLGRWYDEARLFIHARRPLPANGPETIGPALADAAERAIVALFERSGAGTGGIALFAAGSLATRATRFGSDLDLIAVARGEEEAAGGAAAMRSMLEEARAARLDAVDLRLRGEGEGAPLVQTVDYLARYLASRAAPWEILAYSKCRFLAGDAEAGRLFAETLRETLPAVFRRPGWKERVADSRARLESLSRGPWDVKHAPGGLYDVDFIQSAAFLLGHVDTAGSADRGAAFAYLVTLGLLDPGDADTLVTAWRLYWTIEHAAALHGIPYPPLPGREEFFERYLERLLGPPSLPGPGTFLERLEGARIRVRAADERFFERVTG